MNALRSRLDELVRNASGSAAPTLEPTVEPAVEPAPKRRGPKPRRLRCDDPVVEVVAPAQIFMEPPSVTIVKQQQAERARGARKRKQDDQRANTLQSIQVPDIIFDDETVKSATQRNACHFGLASFYTVCRDRIYGLKEASETVYNNMPNTKLKELANEMLSRTKSQAIKTKDALKRQAGPQIHRGHWQLVVSARLHRRTPGSNQPPYVRKVRDSNLRRGRIFAIRRFSTLRRNTDACDKED